jgi:hypothetical protein
MACELVNEKSSDIIAEGVNKTVNERLQLNG